MISVIHYKNHFVKIRKDNMHMIYTYIIQIVSTLYLHKCHVFLYFLDYVFLFFIAIIHDGEYVGKCRIVSTINTKTE